MKIGHNLELKGSNSFLHHYTRIGNSITFSLFRGSILYKRIGLSSYLSVFRMKVYKRCGRARSILGFVFGSNVLKA